MSHDASLNAFFNALIREWPVAHYHQSDTTLSSHHRLPGGYFEIPGTTDTSLLVPCRFRARTGRHLLTGPLMLETGGQRRTIGFTDAVAWCLGLPALQKDGSPDALESIKQRVHTSIRNLTASHGALSDRFDHLFRESLSFMDAEQALFSGHSIHPCPKDRGNMTAGEARDYAPEYGNRFPLAWYSVHRDHLFLRHADGTDLAAAIEPLLKAEPDAADWRSALPPHHCLIPCHPFQHDQWQASASLRAMMDAGTLRYVSHGQSLWGATSSLRAIYSESVPWMLKFSLTVRLTNSVRHLQPEEVVRGAELCRVLNSGPVRRWIESRSDFDVLREPIATGIRGHEGNILTDTLVVWRDNPFQGADAENTEVVATLLQDDPRSGESRLVQRLRQAGFDATRTRDWFRRYLDVAVGPLLEAQSRFGILFGAHQQNLVLRLDGVWPEKLYFRDCQGTGFTSVAVERLGNELSGLADDSENLLPDDLGIRLFCYYLFINATFNVMSSLAAGQLTSEDVLIQTLRDWLLARLDEQPADPRAIHYLLKSPELYAKGNFICTLRALNENTLDDVFSIYHPLTNPLYTEA